MESLTKNKKTREQIESMAKRAFDGVGLAAGEDAVTELKEGWFNVAYNIRLADGREVILKIAPPVGADVLTYEKNIMVTEVASMKLVRQNPNIPVPEIYAFDTARDLCDSDYFFMEKLVGDNLGHVREGLPEETRADIDRQIGAIIREINSFGGEYFGYPGNSDLRSDTWQAAFIKVIDSVLDDGKRKNVVLDFSYEDIRAAVMKHAPALAEVTKPCLVHWDAWISNFFVKDGRVTGLLDFERALWAEPLMEAQFRPLPEPGVTNQMRGYDKTTFTAVEEERSHLYTLHLALIMNIESFYRNYDTDFVFNLSRGVIAETMKWLQEN